MSQSSFPTLIVDRFIPALWGLPAGQTINPAKFLKFNVAQGKENFPFGASVELCNLVGGGDFTGRDNNTTFNTNFTSYIESFGGENNCFFGTGCGIAITTGGSNTGVGHFDIMKNITSGSGNCGVGYGVLQSVVSTDNNTALGTSAGVSLDGTENICIGAGADIIAGVDNSIMIASYGCELGASNCIQINATAGQINQTTASSCVIAPIRSVAPDTTGDFSLPLLYNTTTNEVFNDNRTEIIITATGNTPNNSFYNSFIFISSAASVSGVINIPTAVIDFPATLDIFSNASVTHTITSGGGNIVTGFSGVSGNTYVIQPRSFVRFKTNGTDWYLAGSSGNQTLNSITYGYSNIPTYTSNQLGFVTRNISIASVATTLTTSNAIYFTLTLPVLGTYIINNNFLLDIGTSTTIGIVQYFWTTTLASPHTAGIILGTNTICHLPITTAVTSTSAPPQSFVYTTPNTVVNLYLVAVYGNQTNAPKIGAGNSYIQYTRIA